MYCCFSKYEFRYHKHKSKKEDCKSNGSLLALNFVFFSTFGVHVFFREVKFGKYHKKNLRNPQIKFEKDEALLK